MNSNVISFFVLIAAAYSAPQAAQWPAGVHPSLCPNYPYCDTSVGVVVAPVAPVAPLEGFSTRLYPAGVSPAACPGFPICDNSVVHNTPSVNTVNPVWNQPSTVVVDKYPAGVNPSTCPNYPYCGTSFAAPVAPLEGFSTRLYPAGIVAASCPNYPYC
ncbi:cuticle protein 1-like [Sitodiplosis mosellana]|uniref:cuticle protein 1-like n=1 Tax=Sitodiplosis mosellana TaxID=263140 RepID=UPI0024452FA8|nr:cuticle protein 1-like [Sitodiplosis mosellana]